MSELISEYGVKEMTELIQHPVINNQFRMFKFLRKCGVLRGMVPDPMLESRGLLWVENRSIGCGRTTKRFQKVLFSNTGVQWVSRLLKHYYGDSN